MQAITVLGSTGSIGVSTLDVVARHRARFRVVALAADRQIDRMLAQCRAFAPQYAVMRDEQAARDLAGRVRDAGLATRVLSGEQGLEEVACLPGVDTVMAAIVGAAGLRPTLAAARAGKKVLLANKEALVMAGKLFMEAVAARGARLLPIDSEHNAVLQSLPREFRGDLAAVGVRRIVLTASGGPLRTMPLERLGEVTPEQACAHPNWVMGRKISVDSATMMNKGLEVIEARWLFNAAEAAIDVVIQPQSIVHSLVEYVDGSVLAQLGNPDMRTPIAHALAYPERIESGVAPLDLLSGKALDFEAPDLLRFPCLRLARAALRDSAAAPVALNAANEVAVAAFLAGRLRFDRIAALIEQVMSRMRPAAVDTLDAILSADAEARALATSALGHVAGR